MLKNPTTLFPPHVQLLLSHSTGFTYLKGNQNKYAEFCSATVTKLWPKATVMYIQKPYPVKPSPLRLLLLWQYYLIMLVQSQLSLFSSSVSVNLRGLNSIQALSLGYYLIWGRLDGQHQVGIIIFRNDVNHRFCRQEISV